MEKETFVTVKIGEHEYTLDKRKIKDIKAVRMAAKAQNSDGVINSAALIEFMDYVLGETAAELEKNLADAEGYVSADAYFTAAQELLTQVAEAKN